MSEQSAIDMMMAKFDALAAEARAIGVDCLVLLLEDDRLGEVETWQMIRSMGFSASLGILERAKHNLLTNKDDE
jgi:hypothetical protein